MLFQVVFVLVGSLAAILLRRSRISADPKNITLTWTDDAHTTQTVTWRTAFSPTPGLIQYSEAINDSSLAQGVLTTTAEVQGLSTTIGNISIHSATLKGLKPGTRYIYRVGDGTNWSRQHHFTTAIDNAQAFRFLVFGDTQSSYYLTWRRTLYTAYQTNRDAAFFIHVGDLIDKNHDYKEWNTWFHASQGIIDTIPILPVVGNHETYTFEKKIYAMPTFFTAQFKVPGNGPEGLNGQVYSFEYGNMHFSVLDTQADEEREFEPNMLEKQKIWLENDLQSTDKRWKLVLMHRSPYDNRSKDGNRALRKTFIPIFDKYKVDIVFAGHDHIYARSYPLRNGSIAKSSSAGTIYITAGRTGNKTYKRTQIKEHNEVFHNLVDESNYIAVTVNGGTITAKVFQRSGLLIDEWVISK
ncbi:MAG: metallophosphoesterase [Sporomusa sp.]|jgi:phosphodiesterase/alkaline phosphatase D-like protein|nr:metallophosphoesterase [Sporomusa sp.]